MNVQLWWLAVGIAALCGALVGALAVHIWLGRRQDAAIKRAVDATRRESGATLERLRAAYTTVRLDQEHQRAALPRKLAAATLAQRATIARLEEALRFAQLELDRRQSPTRADQDHGFAPTQTFDDPG